MTWQLVSAILAATALIFIEWLKSRNSTQKALDEKTQALEVQAEQQRQEEQAEDEAEASEVTASGRVDRVIGFVQSSFRKPSKPSNN